MTPIRKQIRDSLYGYIPLSRLEQSFLTQPEILRLHRILQNSTVYQTYPNNRGSRFSHSIGAMHVAGLLYRSIFLNSRDKLLLLTKIISQYLKSIGREDEVAAYLSQSERDAFYEIYGWSLPADIHHVVIFQALRLSALVHDIGHTPYSHISEVVLQEATLKPSNSEIYNQRLLLEEAFREVLSIRSTSPVAEAPLWSQGLIEIRPSLHEMLGIVLANQIFDERLTSDIENEKEFWKACWLTSLKILCADQLGHYLDDKFFVFIDTDLRGVQRLTPWYALANIISGEIDSDRIDYTRRDPHNSGVEEFVSYDFQRIIDNIQLVRPSSLPPKLSSLDLYVPGFDRRALSALESLLFDRMRQFRWIICHHNVVRTDLALQRLLLMIINLLKRRETQGDLVQFLKSQGFSSLWSWDCLTENFRYVDDSWLETILQNLYKYINRTNHRPNTTEADMAIYLAVLFDRRVDLMKALWKRVDGFVPFARAFLNEFKRVLPASLESIWPDHQKQKLLSLLQQDDDTSAVKFTNCNLGLLSRYASTKGQFALMNKFETAVRAHNRPRVLFALKTFSPYKGLPVVMEDGSSRGLESMSNLIANLNNMWEESLQLYAFYMLRPSQQIPDPSTTAHLIETLGSRVAKCILTDSELLNYQPSHLDFAQIQRNSIR